MLLFYCVHFKTVVLSLNLHSRVCLLEEILHSGSAIWWNPDGSGVVYASFDDRDVQRYDLTIYGPLKNKYVENQRLPYPRVC